MNKRSCRVLSALVAINVATLGGTVQAIAEEQVPPAAVEVESAPASQAPVPETSGPAAAPAPVQPTPQAATVPAPVEPPKSAAPAATTQPKVNDAVTEQGPSAPTEESDPAPAAAQKTQEPAARSEKSAQPDKQPAIQQEADAKGSGSNAQGDGQIDGPTPSPESSAGDSAVLSDNLAGQARSAGDDQSRQLEGTRTASEDTSNVAVSPDLPAQAKRGMATTPDLTLEEGAVQNQVDETSRETPIHSSIFVDGTYGSDSNDGTSYERAFHSLRYAVGHRGGAEAIYIRGNFSLPSNTETTKYYDRNYWAIIPAGVTLVVDKDGVTIQSDADKTFCGIMMQRGSTLRCDGDGTLIMSGFDTALTTEGGNDTYNEYATVTDGNYQFRNNTKGIHLAGPVLGSGNKGRESVVIDADDYNNSDFYFNEYKGMDFKNCTATINSSYSTEPGVYQDAWDLRLDNAYIKVTGLGTTFYIGGLDMNNSELVIGTGTRRHSSGIAIQNHGFNLVNSRIEVSEGKLSGISFDPITRDPDANEPIDNEDDVKVGHIINSQLMFDNVGETGLNVYSGTVIFENSTIEDKGGINGALFSVQKTSYKNGAAVVGSIEFRNDCLVITPAQGKDDNGVGVTDANNYVVTGGSHLVHYTTDYSPTLHSYNGTVHEYDTTIPTNGSSNGNEQLALFTLSDSRASDATLHPLNNKGQSYDYGVSRASSDGQKHVWVPAAQVVFLLNADGATSVAGAAFADGTTANKSAYAMRGYALRDAKSLANGGATTMPQNPAAKGYRFVGWFYRDNNGAEREFDEGTTINALSGAPLQVYAKWALVSSHSSTVRSDLLLNNDTESTGAANVAKDSSYELSLRFSGSSLRDDVRAIANDHKNVRHTAIRLYSPNMVFDVTLDFPDAMSLPAGLDANLIRLSCDGFKVNGVQARGNHLSMRVQLARPNGIKTYADLENVLAQALDEDGWLKLVIPGVRVKADAPVAHDLIVRATVKGSLNVDAEPQNGGTRRAYSFAWEGVQWPNGKDAVAGDDDGIRLTARVNEVDDAPSPDAPATPGETAAPLAPQMAGGTTADIPVKAAAQVVPDAPERASIPAKHASSRSAQALPQTGDESTHGVSALFALIGSAFVALAAALRRHGKKA